MTKQLLTACWLTGILVVGCGSAAVPQERLTSAQAAVKGAEVAGAPEDPKAALHLKLANEQIARAKALISDDQNEDAARVLDRAQADADLALMLAKESRAKREAAGAREQIEELQRRMAQ